MSEPLSGWLRQQRQSQGWAVPEMARRLRETAQAVGDMLPASTTLITMIRRWERGAGVSERYRLHYCRVLGIAFDQFGCDRQARTNSAETAVIALTAARPGTAPAPHAPTPLARTGNQPEHIIAYGGSWDHDPGAAWIRREVLMAAHESSEDAERAEHREIGDATLEQLRADVMRLSRESMTDEPFPVFLEMRRVRDRMHAALDRRLWPRDQGDLYFLLGCLNGLMAVGAWHLGSPAGAEELLRAGWAYAIAIDNRPLLGHLRLAHADVAYWNSQPWRCRDLAKNGLEYLPHGPNGALLHLVYARAAAQVGDADETRRAVLAAYDARERDFHDDLLEIGGEFSFSMASQHYFAGSAYVSIPQGGADAATELERAILLYESEPEPGEQHSDYCKMAARIDLATADLKAGRLDGAVVAVDPVLVLPPSRRVSSLPQCFARVRSELAQPIYHGSAQARELDERIEQFCRETVVADLHSLPGGSA